MTDERLKEIKRPGQILDYVDTKEHLLELFNYITNLQQENNNLKTSLDESQEVVIDLQQENDDLKSRLENAVADCNLRLQEFKDYKSRIEKAIPMLKELNIKLKGILNTGIDIKELSDIEDTLNGRSDDEGGTLYMTSTIWGEDLLNILRGEDK